MKPGDLITTKSGRYLGVVVEHTSYRVPRSYKIIRSIDIYWFYCDRIISEDDDIELENFHKIA